MHRLTRRILGSSRESEVMAILCIEIMVVLLGHSLVVPLLSIYAQSLGASLTIIGLVAVMPGLTRLLANVPIGRLADRIGRRPMLVAGPFMICATAILSGLAPNYWWLIVARGLHGFGSGAYLTAASVVVADISPPSKRARMMSMQHGSMLLGASMGPIFGGLIAEYLDYRAVFYVYAVLVVVAGIWAYLRIPETRDWQAAGTPDEPSEQPPQTGQPVRLDTRRLLTDLNFLLVCLVYSTVLITRSGSQLTVVPLLGANQLGLSPGQIGMAFTVFSIGDFITMYAAGFIADRFGRKVAVVPAGFVSAAGLVLFVLSPNYAVYLLATVLLGMGTGISGPAQSAYVVDLARRGSYGMIFGLYRTAGDLGFAIGGLGMGLMADSLGMSTALLVNAAVIVVSSGLFGVLARESVPARESTAGATTPAVTDRR